MDRPRLWFLRNRLCHFWNLRSNSASGSSPNSSASKSSPVTSHSQHASQTLHVRQTSDTSHASPHSGQNITPLSAYAYGTRRIGPSSSDEQGGWYASRASRILGYDE